MATVGTNPIVKRDRRAQLSFQSRSEQLCSLVERGAFWEAHDHGDRRYGPIRMRETGRAQRKQPGRQAREATLPHVHQLRAHFNIEINHDAVLVVHAPPANTLNAVSSR